MKEYLLLFIVVFAFGARVGYGQSTGEIERLHATIDSLNLELEKCRHLTLYQMMMPGEAKTSYPKEEEYTHREFRQKLMDDMRSKSPASLENAVNVTQLVDEFAAYCDLLKEEIIGRTGGLDQENMPAGLTNRDEVNKMFLGEKRAAVLQSKMAELRTALLSATDDRIDKSKIATGRPLSIESGKSWEEYTFRNMPVAAVLPLLAKFRNDALNDEIVILKHLNGDK